MSTEKGPVESEETRRARLPNVMRGYAKTMDKFDHLTLDSDHTSAMRRSADEIERLRARLQRAEELLRDVRANLGELSLEEPTDGECVQDDKKRIDAFLGERHEHGS